MGRRKRPWGEHRQQRKGKTSPSSGYAEVVRSLRHVLISQHRNGKKQTLGPGRRRGDARSAHQQARSRQWEAMGRAAGPRERQQ